LDVESGKLSVIDDLIGMKLVYGASLGLIFAAGTQVFFLKRH